MPTRSEAEDNLRVIRSLMERATIYRAVSAPVALAGGIFALLGCGFIAMEARASSSDRESSVLFLATWLVVLFITGCANTFFLIRDAKQRDEAILSERVRAALRALIPGFLTAGVLSFLLADCSFALPIVWMILYGISLLGTQHFAPRSLILLGWAFLLTGLGFTIFFFSEGSLQNAHYSPPYYMPNLAMGATFGLFHLVYAACTWPRKSSNTAPGVEP
ncbi:MAG TPA: hypothetical protein VG733_04575 [Chthoniobacteraceae bacterium]|nr:hypothetical protein [Chthoniobacteraceae bacterium]